MKIAAAALVTLGFCVVGPAGAQEPSAEQRAVADLGQSVHREIKCQDCHGGFAPPYGDRVPAAGCMPCHEDQERGLEKSVHGPVAGERRPGCTTCHGNHGIQAVEEQKWRVGVLSLCGQCHGEVAEKFRSSIHGEAVIRGVSGAPVCTSCHGEHAILKTDDPRGAVYVANLPKTCAACHESERLAERYGVPVRRLRTFEDSYHGLALRFGEVTVANCASCHGTHDIYPPSDPRSTISPGRVAQTCGRCHPGAGKKFAIGKVHVEATAESSLPVYLVRQFYTWFIGILVVGFLIHVGLDLLGARRRRKDAGGR